MTGPFPPQPVVITPAAGTRLEQLAGQYDLAKAEADKAAEAFEAVKTALKLELTHAAPGATDVRLDSPDLAAPLQLKAVESWRIDTARMKKDAPETYVRYAKQSTSWRLSAVSS